MKKELEIDFSYNKIFEILDGSDDTLKAFALLELNEVQTEADFELLIKHLTNCDGRLRELVSSKLVELKPQKRLEAYIPTLLDALCDVNPNVARNIVELLSICNINIAEPLLERAEDILMTIEKNSKPKKWRTQKNHVLTKIIFHLYWCLEALALFANVLPKERLTKILNTTSDFVDYTIREKTAKILVKMPEAPEDLLSKMQNDDNFYVKLHFCGSI